MRITVTRRGGFAGLDQPLGTQDVSGLTESAAAAAARELAKLDDLAEKLESAGADKYRYEIEVEEPGKAARLLTIADEGDPERPEMKSLAALAAALGIGL